MKTADLKSERIATRVTAEQKSKIAQAAALRGRSLTDFMVESAQRAAEAVLEESHVIRLSAEHQKRFAEALLKPSKPNEALKAASRAYDESGILSR